MRTTDRFLLALSAGIALLVAAAVAAALQQPDQRYRADDTPAAAAHNYLLALRRDEFARAYGALSPSLPGRPASLEAFTSAVLSHPWSFRRQEPSVGLTVESTTMVAPDHAIVSVRERRFTRVGLFGSSTSSELFELQLARADGAWRLAGAEGDFFWVPCWSSGCS